MWRFGGGGRAMSLRVVVAAQDGETTHDIHGHRHESQGLADATSERALAERGDAVACLRDGDYDVYGIGGARGGGDDGDSYGGCDAMRVKLNGVEDADDGISWDQLAVGVGETTLIAVELSWRRTGKRRRRYSVTVTRAGSADATSERAVAEWSDAVPAFRVGDDGVHGVGGARGGGDDGDGYLS